MPHPFKYDDTERSAEQRKGTPSGLGCPFLCCEAAAADAMPPQSRARVARHSSHTHSSFGSRSLGLALISTWLHVPHSGHFRHTLVSSSRATTTGGGAAVGTGVTALFPFVSDITASLFGSRGDWQIMGQCSRSHVRQQPVLVAQIFDLPHCRIPFCRRPQRRLRPGAVFRTALLEHTQAL